jgi:hydrogenase maturation factor
VSVPIGELSKDLLKEYLLQRLPVQSAKSFSLPRKTNLVVGVKPVLGVPSDLCGFYAANVSASRVAAQGGYPRFLLADLLYPISTEIVWIKRIAEQLNKEARRLNIKIMGLHSGGYGGLSIPIISTFCLGYEIKGISRRVRDGDVVMVAGRPLLEIAIYASYEKQQLVKMSGGNPNYLKNAYAKLSVVKSSISAYECKAKCVADVGEFGIVRVLKELSQRLGKAIQVDKSKVPWNNVGLKITELLGGDPMSATSYGTIAIITSSKSSKSIENELDRMHTPVVTIGRVVGGSGVWDFNGAPITQHKDVYTDLLGLVR